MREEKKDRRRKEREEEGEGEEWKEGTPESSLCSTGSALSGTLQWLRTLGKS